MPCILVHSGLLAFASWCHHTSQKGYVVSHIVSWLTDFSCLVELRSRTSLPVFIVSLPGIAMPATGLCFAYVSFIFQMSPLSFDNGWTDNNANCCCANTVEEKFPWLKFCELRFSNPCDFVAHLHGDLFRDANMRTMVVKCHPLGDSIAQPVCR